MRRIWVFLYCSFFVFCFSQAQAPKQSSPSDIYHAIQKLNFLGSALYVAAHPDDENTRLISYLSNKVHARTAYLSLTRGDGGQNLIGSELRELLGVLRTQELLAARRIDGGEQLFTRANDFGYSKNPKETLEIWNKESVLGDVVTTIRKFKPDVIINRFDHRSPGTTHGHHTASAMLSMEAFDMANDANAFSERLTNTEPWQPKRLFFNTSWWFYGSEEAFEKADKSKMITMDVGTYYPILGKSNNEIASLASSQHLCQGFGRLSSRGSQPEYVELLKGDLPDNPTDLFAGIDTSWNRITGGAQIGALLYDIEKNFNFKAPHLHLPQLVQAYSLLQKVKDTHWKNIKTDELTAIILAVAGLHLEVSAADGYANPGESVSLSLEALNRSPENIRLLAVRINGALNNSTSLELMENQLINQKLDLQIPLETKYTSPYWLMEKGTLGTYKVTDMELIGKPETPRAFCVTFDLEIAGTVIPVAKPVIYRYAKPEKGELYQPFEIVPPATASFKDKVIIFANDTPKEIAITVKAHADNLSGTVALRFDDVWTIPQNTKPFSIAKKGDEQTVSFTLRPPDVETENYITPIIQLNGQNISKELISIAYDHVPVQTILLPSEAKTVRLDIQKAGEHIGYIMGAGDEMPTSLEQMGYDVHIVDPASIGEGSLKQYDAVVLGIRAYNVIEELKFKQRFILNYVKEGGTLIVQYNTANRWGKQFENIAPYTLEISSDRVTNENAEVRILAKEHPLMNYPNKITSTDFKGWVQERGLYFPDTWGAEFTPILGMNDEGESEKKGSLLVAPYGKGNYIYTGLSFFRELPAGVPGAYKLFSNMLSIGKDNLEPIQRIKG